MARPYHKAIKLDKICELNILKDKICWMCGTQDNLSRHHIIPRAFKPEHNMTIPLCMKCHRLIHGVVDKHSKRRKKKNMHHAIRLPETHKKEIPPQTFNERGEGD